MASTLTPVSSERRSRLSSWRSSLWDSATTSYYLVGGSTLLLLSIGLVMVLSASTVFSLRDTGGLSPYGDFLDQLRFAAMGLPAAVIVSRFKVEWLRKLAWVGMIGALGLQMLLLVPGLQRAHGGNAGWVYLGGVSFQPSEFGKLGLAVWLGAVLATKGKLLKQWQHVLVPAVLVAGVFLGFVLYGHDLGTALILVALVAAALWVAGVPASMFTVVGALVTTAVFFLVFTSPNRRGRIEAFFTDSADPLGAGLQPRVALEALATGGISGVGLGGSRVKWLYLPEAYNDYIFAIIGEELGLLGALLVIGMFTLLAVAFTRIIRRHPDPFVKIATAAIGAWIISQAFVNIAVVIGLLPVIGVPLPLISAGGSSLITTLVALGIVTAFARSEPGAPEAFAARRRSIRRSLAVLTPRRAAGRGAPTRSGVSSG